MKLISNLALKISHSTIKIFEFYFQYSQTFHRNQRRNSSTFPGKSSVAGDAYRKYLTHELFGFIVKFA